MADSPRVTDLPFGHVIRLPRIFSHRFTSTKPRQAPRFSRLAGDLSKTVTLAPRRLKTLAAARPPREPPTTATFMFDRSGEPPLPRRRKLNVVARWRASSAAVPRMQSGVAGALTGTPPTRPVNWLRRAPPPHATQNRTSIVYYRLNRAAKLNKPCSTYRCKNGIGKSYSSLGTNARSSKSCMHSTLHTPPESTRVARTHTHTHLFVTAGRPCRVNQGATTAASRGRCHVILQMSSAGRSARLPHIVRCR